MTNRIIDSVTIADASASITPEGYMIANARTARTGIQLYRGSEMGRPELDIVSVYRDEKEVFSKRSLDTFSKLPITIDHPADAVTAENWRNVAVGTTGDDVLRDGEYLRIGLKITDASAVKEVKDGKRELSVGYSAEIVWEDGVTPDGQKYQAKQTNIVANHIAIVDKGRAGNRARIGDSWGAAPIQDKKGHSQPGITPTTTGGRMTDQVKTVVLGDAAVQVAISDVAAVESFKAASVKALQDAQTAHDAAIAAKDEELGKLKAELKTAQDAANIDIDALVASRAALVSQVKAFDAKIDTTGKTDAELRRTAVVAKLGDAMVKDASDAEITGMFKALANNIKTTNPVADAMSNGIQKTGDASQTMQDALDKSIADLNAWRKGV